MLKRIKRVVGYAAHARFLAECDFTNERIPRQVDIPSPYSSGPDHTVLVWKGKRVIDVETAHRRYDVFLAPSLPGSE